MGQFTLQQFRNRLSGVLEGYISNRVDDDRLDGWVNSARIEVETANDLHFSELRETWYIDTVDGTWRYALPSNVLSIIDVRDVTNGIKLLRTDAANLLARRVATEDQSDDEGEPEYYARRGSELLLYPMPDDAYEIEGLFVIEESSMSAASDTTSIPSTWDNAILFLAIHYALLELGREEESEAWLKRYFMYVGSRKQEGSYGEQTSVDPIYVPDNLGEIRDR